MKIGFVLPCYNEFENIFILIKQIKKIFKDHLIVVVDDSSTSEIKNRIIKYKKIKYFKRKVKSGRGSAVLFGMNKILQDTKVDLIVEMDTDLSSHPKELPENIKYFKKEKLDLLVMSRYLKGSKIINWPIRRRLFSFLSNKLANFLPHLQTHYFQGDLAVFHVSAPVYPVLLHSQTLIQFEGKDYLTGVHLH